ncbi:GumC family protein [Pseudomonas putida]|uniref:GumC family protein n=1 Tax=Pseudomonas putida TaxID=303 RepID=UPI002365EE29|nr:Wzz/FepE/Etk N-terminal domain-containing protein [Pseudomonas putida]MDD2046724.1 Wzz/FepE/Etk N-terminal domain-containing protein [Pseudomonas putida]
MKSEYELSLNDYIAIIKDRALLLGVSIVVILAVTAVVAVTVPPIYQSTGTILVESQQISPELVSANNNSFADERIEVIRQRVMTRDNLLRIIDKYNLFADKGGRFSEFDKIDLMRNSIVVATLSTFIKGRGEATVAFNVSFEHKRPEVAKEVANELVTLFLNENIKQRTERASETTVFLTQEANKLGAELASLENQLADFKQTHANALPEHQALRMGMLSRSELEYREVDRDYKAAQEELRYLELELSAANAGLTSKAEGAKSVADQPQDLPSLKAEYTRLLTRYTDAHPDVVAVKRKIQALEATGVRGAPASTVSLDVARVRTRIGAAQERIASLAEQKRELVKKMEGYEAEILEAPQVERGLVTLMRDHDNARKKYEEIRAKEMGAKITESLEQENKAERFVLLEPPMMPEKPVKPNRKKIAALGLVLAPAGGAALVMLLEMLNQRVRGVGALESVVGRRVLVAIPYIPTQADLAQRKKWRKLLLLAGLVLVAILMVLVHVFYMPLDLLLFKAMARFE